MLPVPAAVFQRCSITLRQNLKGKKTNALKSGQKKKGKKKKKQQLDINRGVRERERDEGGEAFYNTFFSHRCLPWSEERPAGSLVAAAAINTTQELN